MNYINEQISLKHSILQIINDVINDVINKILCETNETNERVGSVNEIEVNNIFFKKIYKCTEIYYRNIVDKSFIYVTIDIEFYENELNLILYETCNDHNDDNDDRDQFVEEDVNFTNKKINTQVSATAYIHDEEDEEDEDTNIDARSLCSVKSDSYSISSSISSNKREKGKKSKKGKKNKKELKKNKVETVETVDIDADDSHSPESTESTESKPKTNNLGIGGVGVSGVGVSGVGGGSAHSTNSTRPSSLNLNKIKKVIDDDKLETSKKVKNVTVEERIQSIFKKIRTNIESEFMKQVINYKMILTNTKKNNNEVNKVEAFSHLILNNIESTL
jgi:hypothetical protein